MNEQIKDKNNLSPENLEDQKYATFQTAMNEVDRIMKEMNDIFTITPNRKEAEKIIMEKYATQMDDAIEKSKQASSEWFNAIEEARKKEQE
jgi:CHASE3 domain sensor protein